MAKLENNVGEAPNSRFRGNLYSAMERLPAPLRRSIHEGVVEWDPRWIRWLLNKAVKAGVPEHEAVVRLRLLLAKADEEEVLDFSFAFQSRYCTSTPHVAASATIMRYEAAR